ncbi:tetratricopeptide repeat protein [Roseomonas xinghualingensis]|uniref:tetratricopeptide repeat protein n=1 Tax=Roseomonas xinghualingensis TaxID=2986475 RepID=UPI0021F1884A|nr:hypothetical protein [Roseomonas sp. SXEYE001]MCV4207335.1 hypothetical protein [Roseomonas sp. SXEYE001]
MRRMAAMGGMLLLFSGLASAQVMPLPGGPEVGPAIPPSAMVMPKPGAETQRREELNRLLDALAQAPDESAAAQIQAQVQALWAQGGTPTVGLLLRKGLRSMQENAVAEAVEDLDAAITLQPDFAESWVLRAQVLAASGDRRAAAADLREALRLEPRHFGALLALSELQEDAGDLAGALRSLDAALRIHPRLPGGTQKQRDLRRRALGDVT